MLKEQFTEDQVVAYLGRIGCALPVSLDIQKLNALIFAHQTSIPFETVSMRRAGCAPLLGLHDIYEKVIVRQLGGYCFELGKLFEALLVSLGFDAEPRLCRAVRGRNGRMPINHRGIVVNLDGDSFFCDVGFGGPMAASALKLQDDLEQISREDVFVTREDGNGWWCVDRKTRSTADFFDDGAPERWQTELELCNSSVEDQDFDSLSLFFSRPGTLFREHDIVNLRTDDGHISLRDAELTIRKNGKKQIIEIGGDDYFDALREYFGLVYNEPFN